MHSNKKIDQFNMLLVGTGGQGQITLLQILAEAALIEKFDFKSSELHGLSQRGGSVEVHLRFGQKIYSPMISANRADLVLALEMQETLAAANFINPQTKLLINKYLIPVPEKKPWKEKDLLNKINKLSQEITLVPASEICQKHLGTNVTAGIYLISLASFEGFLPFRPEAILQAIKKIIPKKHLELNLKTFNLARSNVALKA